MCGFLTLINFPALKVDVASLERIQGYIDIEHEPTPTEGGKPPAAWPTSGGLHVEKLSARYSAVSNLRMSLFWNCTKPIYE